MSGRVAQLGQSTGLRSRVSPVRLRSRPSIPPIDNTTQSVHSITAKSQGLTLTVCK